MVHVQVATCYRSSAVEILFENAIAASFFYGINSYQLRYYCFVVKNLLTLHLTVRVPNCIISVQYCSAKHTAKCEQTVRKQIVPKNARDVVIIISKRTQRFAGKFKIEHLPRRTTNHE